MSNQRQIGQTQALFSSLASFFFSISCIFFLHSPVPPAENTQTDTRTVSGEREIKRPSLRRFLWSGFLWWHQPLIQGRSLYPAVFSSPVQHHRLNLRITFIIWKPQNNIMVAFENGKCRICLIVSVQSQVWLNGISSKWAKMCLCCWQTDSPPSLWFHPNSEDSGGIFIIVKITNVEIFSVQPPDKNIPTTTIKQRTKYEPCHDW